MLNTSSEMNSTPKPFDQNKSRESLIDFSTPMSTISNQKSNSSLLEKLFDKFHEHQTNFSQTQNYLNLFDNHLRELSKILNQLQYSFDSRSPFKFVTEQIETRLLQMSTKREQIRLGINHYYQTIESKYSYIELINALKLSFNQKTHLIEHLYQDEKQFDNRKTDYRNRISQQEQILRQLIEKILNQQKTMEEFAQIKQSNKYSSNIHMKQVDEFQKLYEEYQRLQEEHQQLKQKAKDNINKLYTSINQTAE